MNLLLMYPLTKEPIRYPYLGLGYLATYVRDLVDNIDIFIPKKTDSKKTLIARLQAFNPDLIAISIYSLSFYAAKKTIQMIKKLNKKIIIVVGGPHPSGDPKGTLKTIPQIDFAFIGEAEIGFYKFIKLFKNKKNLKNPNKLSKVPGLVWRKQRQIIVNKPAFIEDLDSIGWPAYDLMPPNSFTGSTGSGFMKSKHIGFICSSRGCPRQCTFCAGHVVNSRKNRRRNPKDVVKEMELLYKKYSIREIQFTDPDLALNKNHLNTICQLMVKKKLKLHWSCAVHSASLDKNSIKLMKQGGCYMVRVGIETGSQRIARMIKKGVNYQKLKQLINDLRKEDIHVHGFFMMGFPTETKEEIEQTLKLSRSLGLDSASFAILQPLPGSEIYEDYIKSNPDQKLNWENFNYFRDSGFKTSISFKELKKIQRKAYLKFYLRPRLIFSTTKKFLGLSKTNTLIKMIKRNLIN